MGAIGGIDEEQIMINSEDVVVDDYELSHHIRQALKSALTGDTDEYDQLIGNMYHNVNLLPDEVAMLVTILRALSDAVSYIDVVHHRTLLSSICGMSFWNYGPDVMDALVELVLALQVHLGSISKNDVPSHHPNEKIKMLNREAGA